MTLITDANSLNKTGIYRTGATWTGSVHTAGSGSNQGVLYHAEAYTGFTYSTQLWMRMQNVYQA